MNKFWTSLLKNIQAESDEFNIAKSFWRKIPSAGSRIMSQFALEDDSWEWFLKMHFEQNVLPVPIEPTVQTLRMSEEHPELLAKYDSKDVANIKKFEDTSLKLITLGVHHWFGLPYHGRVQEAKKIKKGFERSNHSSIDEYIGSESFDYYKPTLEEYYEALAAKTPNRSKIAAAIVAQVSKYSWEGEYDSECKSLSGTLQYEGISFDLHIEFDRNFELSYLLRPNLKDVDVYGFTYEGLMALGNSSLDLFGVHSIEDDVEVFFTSLSQLLSLITRSAE